MIDKVRYEKIKNYLADGEFVKESKKGVKNTSKISDISNLESNPI